MNERQIARRRRFAEMRKQQRRKATSRGGPEHRADAMLIKNPKGPWRGDANLNQYHMFADDKQGMAGLAGVEHYSPEGELLADIEQDNGIVNEGLNNNLNVYFDSGTLV